MDKFVLFTIVFLLHDALAVPALNSNAPTEKTYHTRLGNILFNRHIPSSSSSINEFFDSLEKNVTAVSSTKKIEPVPTKTVVIETTSAISSSTVERAQQTTVSTLNFDPTSNCTVDQSTHTTLDYKYTAATDKPHTDEDVEDSEIKEIYKKLKESLAILKEILSEDISKTTGEMRSALKNHIEVFLVKTQKLRTLSREMLEMLMK